MILKFKDGDTSFRLFDNVKNIGYTAENTYLPACTEKETILQYFDSMAESTVRRVKTFIDSPNSPSDFIRVYMGERRANEQFNIKNVYFTQNDIGYCVYTEYPVYVCNDDGKTIDTIK
jgi:hypothetical protein